MAVTQEQNIIKELTNQIAALKQELTHRDDFLAYIHHEINGLVHNVHFTSDVLASSWDKLPAEHIKEYINIIFASAEYLKITSTDLFDTSRFNQDNLQQGFIQVDLVELISDIIERCNKIFLAQKDLQIIFKNTGGNNATNKPVWVNADDKKLRQLLFNLLVNAIKYSQRGIINVSLESAPQEGYHQDGVLAWQVNIQDQGMGIPESDLESIFTPYFRVTKNNKTIPGYGLGLSFCKHIIDAHSGRIWAQNNQNGVGVTFSFQIPAFAA